MENKELENVIETSWESRDEINEKTVGRTKEAVEQTLNLLGNGSLRVCLLYTSPSPRDQRGSRMPSCA